MLLVALTVVVVAITGIAALIIHAASHRRAQIHRSNRGRIARIEEVTKRIAEVDDD